MLLYGHPSFYHCKLSGRKLIIYKHEKQAETNCQPEEF